MPTTHTHFCVAISLAIPDNQVSHIPHQGEAKANLLIYTGPLPDGSIHPEDVATLRSVGKRIRSEGFPK